MHSVFRKDYVWDPYRPASGDVREHGIYSFKESFRCREEYRCSYAGGPLLFGKVKIWGEIVEHGLGYRSEFARIVSLDYGDYGLLEKFRAIQSFSGRNLMGFRELTNEVLGQATPSR